MKEYIERAALKRELAPYEENDFSQQINVILAIVDAQPAADVAPVVHGRWVNHFDYMMERSGFFVCDSCKKMSREKYDYCPNCGTRMDKEDEHETD